MNTTTERNPTIYLAGPDVFFPDREQVFEKLRHQCAELGLVGIEPSDAGLSAGFKAGSDDELAQRIYDANIELLRSANAVVANLAPFRGVEPDSGSVFEVAFAIALGKPVAAYGVSLETYAERVAKVLECESDGRGGTREVASKVLVEGLGQRLNLMLSRSTTVFVDSKDALAHLAAKLKLKRN